MNGHRCSNYRSRISVGIDYQPFGHFVCLRFVDQLPNRNKLNSIIKDMSKFPDVRLVDYNYIVKPIDETTDMTGLEITKH